MALNKVMLIGNVGKDPEVRYLDGNSANGVNAKVATFPLATSERYRDRNGALHENREWHNIVAWRGNADVIERFVKKGSQLYIEGSIRTRQWTDQSGNKRYTTEIVVSSLQLLGRRPDSDGANGQNSASRSAQPYQAQQQSYQNQQPYAQQQSYQNQQPYAQQQPYQAPAADMPGPDPAEDDLPF